MSKSLRLLATFFLILQCGISVAASSKGTDFWFAYPKGATINPVAGNSSASASVAFTVTGDIGTTLSITHPSSSGSGSTSTTGTLQATSAGSSYGGYYRLRFSLNPDYYQATQTDGIDTRTYHVVASAPVSIEQDYTISYYPTPTSSVSPPDARWQAIPTDSLGKEYYVLSYQNQSVAYGSNDSRFVRDSEGTQFVVVATADATDVTITPSVTFGSRVANTPYTISLNQGQEYRAFSSATSADLTGTIISATKPVSVVSGHSCAEIPARLSSATSTLYCSTIMETLFPTGGWSKQFIVPIFSAIPNGISPDQFRFIANKDGTQVSLNDRGILHTFNLAKGEWGQYVPYGANSSSTSPVPLVVNSNYPILVAQYMGEDISYSTEPAMTMVPGYDNYLTSYLFNFPQDTTHSDYINIIAPTADTGSLRLDGSPFGQYDFSPVAGTNYSWAYKSIASTSSNRGNHTITGSSAFGLVAYSSGSYSAPLGTATSPGFNLLAGSKLSISSTQNRFLMGDKACLTVTALDASNNPITNLALTLTISGANSGTQTVTTDANGTAAPCYVGATIGTDTLFVTDSSGSQSNELSFRWVNVGSISLSPKLTSSAFVNETLCAIASVVDTDGQPAPPAAITFTVTGVNPQTGIIKSNLTGTAEFCYVGTEFGNDTLTAGIQSVLSPPLALSWLSPIATITFSSQSANVMVGKKVCLSATGLDSKNLPVSNVSIKFDITGADSLSGTSKTNASGVSEYCYVPENSGVDQVSAISGGAESTIPVTVTIQSNPTCDVVSPAIKNTFVKEVLGHCLSVLSKSGELSQYASCESTAESSFVSALQSINVASGCLASGKTVPKADQLLALIKSSENPVLTDFTTAIEIFGKARALRRINSITTQIFKFTDACLNNDGKLNGAKAENVFESLFVLDGKPVINVAPTLFVGQLKKSCSAISEF